MYSASIMLRVRRLVASGRNHGFVTMVGRRDLAMGGRGALAMGESKRGELSFAE
jgi:hypothetical protein